ncbi:MAG: hypothetical protein LUF04_14645 [Bacteroides sp.]|nr:hypothetical protein [Bacteroides sp.]
MQVILETARQQGIEVKGHLKFGRRPETQAAFKKECDALIRQLTDTYQKYHPLGELVSVMTFLRDMLVEHQGTLQEAIGEATAEQNKILNTFGSSQDDFSSSYKSVANRFQSMIETFNNRCAGATFCGGAAAALVADIQQIANSIDSMTDAYNDIDYNSLVQYGGIMSRIGELEERN